MERYRYYETLVRSCVCSIDKAVGMQGVATPTLLGAVNMETIRLCDEGIAGSRASRIKGETRLWVREHGLIGGKESCSRTR